MDRMTGEFYAHENRIGDTRRHLADMQSRYSDFKSKSGMFSKEKPPQQQKAHGDGAVLSLFKGIDLQPLWREIVPGFDNMTKSKKDSATRSLAEEATKSKPFRDDSWLKNALVKRDR